MKFWESEQVACLSSFIVPLLKFCYYGEIKETAGKFKVTVIEFCYGEKGYEDGSRRNERYY